jgi:hypothetical protein
MLKTLFVFCFHFNTSFRCMLSYFLKVEMILLFIGYSRVGQVVHHYDTTKQFRCSSFGGHPIDGFVLYYFTLIGNNSNATMSDECLMSNCLW